MDRQEIPYSRFHRVSDLAVDLSNIKRTIKLTQLAVDSPRLYPLDDETREALSHVVYLLGGVGERAIEHFADLCDHIGCGSEFRDNARPLTSD